jgi:hypothetical protein
MIKEIFSFSLMEGFFFPHPPLMGGEGRVKEIWSPPPQPSPIKIKGESLSDRPPGEGIALKSFISIIFLRNKTLRINMVFNKGIKNQ